MKNIEVFKEKTIYLVQGFDKASFRLLQPSIAFKTEVEARCYVDEQNRKRDWIIYQVHYIDLCTFSLDAA
jgi:hypothetical protein